MQNLHIVINSELQTHSGGRETWLAYFLNGLLKSNKEIFQKIYVYYRNSSFQDIIPNNIHHEKLVFVRLKDKPKKRNALNNFFNFSTDAFFKVSNYLKDGDKVLLVGSIAEGLAGLIINYFSSRDISIITWVRSMAVEEVGSDRGGKTISIARFIEKNILKVSDKIITNGPDTYDGYVSKYPSYKEKIKLIPNAVDFLKYQNVKKTKLSNKPIKIYYLGRFARAKGFHYYIDSIHDYNLKKHDNDLEFYACGGGNVNEYVMPKNLILQSGVPNELMPQKLSEIDVLVFLNDSDNLGAGGISHSLLEAMAAGKLIICWDNKVHTQVLDNNSAIFVEKYSTSKLAESYEKLMRIDNIENMTTKAVKIAETYAIDKHIEKFITL